jgi:hypothetical protein
MFVGYKFIIMKQFSTKTIYILFTFILFTACKKDATSETENDLKAENRKSLGTSAEDILSSDIYPNLTVEFVYSSLFKPTRQTLTNFRDFLELRLNKTGSITFVETEIDPPTGAPFSIEEIKAIEDSNRTIYSAGDELSVFVFFSNGFSSNDTNTSVTLGTAYLNTSIVIYEKTLQKLVKDNPNIDLSELESATLQHEFGHILGLVNLGSDDIHADHEDVDHPKHCMVEECLMYFESDTRSSIIERFSGRRIIPQLDPLCIADLKAKGGK